ncbi:Uncharacterised protein [Citrobacter freundii]|nr:Uncharacterised protein [Citrobacter freundii]
MSGKNSMKCLFGLHEFTVIQQTKKQYYRKEASIEPYLITFLFVSRCERCGKITYKEIR